MSHLRFFDVLVLDQQLEDKTQFAQLVEAWNLTNVGQVMVERVDSIWWRTTVLLIWMGK